LDAKDARLEFEAEGSCVQGCDDGNGCGDLFVAVREVGMVMVLGGVEFGSRFDVMKKKCEGQEFEFEAGIECCG
jgi:hypothetical protein